MDGNWSRNNCGSGVVSAIEHLCRRRLPVLPTESMAAVSDVVSLRRASFSR